MPTPAPPRRVTRRRFLRHVATVATLGATGCATPTRDPRPLPGLPEGFGSAPPDHLSIEVTPAPVTAPGPRLHHAPDFTLATQHVAGVRPYRHGGPRIEAQSLDDRVIVHHYGHGGAGITLAPGSAVEAVTALHAAESAATDRPVAVIGAGVIGLWTAHELLARGRAVTVYAAAHGGPRTTSMVAGGQFAPSLVGGRHTERMTRMIRASWLAYAERVGTEWGISRRINYATARGGSGLRDLPVDLAGAPEACDPLPFHGVTVAGTAHPTLLVEPPIMLPMLRRELERAGVTFVSRTFTTRAEVLDLPERSIIACVGLGGAALFGDDRLQPIRGQLLHLMPQDLPWMLSHRGYIFPRRDAVVLGGTIERGRTTGPTEIMRLLRLNERFFTT